jgi:hypothetical protein
LTKQSKTDESGQSTDGEQKPLVTATKDQAPVIPFAPYVNNEYTEPYSPLLLEKANVLAGKIWGDQASYDAFTYTYARGDTKEAAVIIEKNKAFFDHGVLNAVVRNLFTIKVPGSTPNVYDDMYKADVLIKKLGRLEKKFELTELFSENAVEQIVENILMPAKMYGVYHDFGGYTSSFRLQQQKAVINELLTMDEINLIDTIIAYVSKIRDLLSGFRIPGRSGRVDEKRLVTGWMPVPNSYVSTKDEMQLLNDISNFTDFFNCAFPYALCQDLLPTFKFPSLTAQRRATLETASANLRDGTVVYIRDQKSLTPLLRLIVELSDALQGYFTSLLSDLEAYFNFINRLGIRFEKLVSESRLRIDDTNNPF